MTRLSWQYNEFQIVGRNYGSKAEAAVYDASHATFRDIEAEASAVLDMLSVQRGDVVIDFGSGTGTFAMQAARRGAIVKAVDVSAEMIAVAKAKAAQAGVSGIEFHHAGFLTYEHSGRAADVIASTFSFHHLPDFWKGIALRRLSAMLRPGGLLYLHDVILEEPRALENIQAFIQRQMAAGGDFMREDAEGHFRDEYSTYDWVMDGLLARAGFSIRSKRMEGGVLGTYVCVCETADSSALDEKLV